jgi:hypothetical protein
VHSRPRGDYRGAKRALLMTEELYLA